MFQVCISYPYRNCYQTCLIAEPGARHLDYLNLTQPIRGLIEMLKWNQISNEAVENKRQKIKPFRFAVFLFFSLFPFFSSFVMVWGDQLGNCCSEFI